MNLNEEQRQKVLQALATARDRSMLNLLKKLNDGRVLTKGEQEQVDAYLKEQNPTEPHPRYGHLPEWANNKVEAAQMLGWRHRNYFAKWKRLKPDDAPPDPANGRINLWAWFDFIEKFGLKPADDDDPMQRRQEAEARKAEAQAGWIEDRRARARGQVVELTTVNRNYTLAILTAKNRLLGLGNALAKELAFISDPEKIKEIVNDHVRLAIEPLSKEPHNGFKCECGREIKMTI